MVTLEIPNQVGITKDNVNIEIDGILYYRIVDPYKASYNIDDPEFAIQQLAMSTMRVEVGKLDLEKIFEEREIMNRAIVNEINKSVDSWGLHCDRYEIRTSCQHSSGPGGAVVRKWRWFNHPALTYTVLACLQVTSSRQ
jgi:regulator of protease activity HflC (stomatin/prohibitin superfamily)